MDLISISQAAEKGIERLRKPNWSNPMDHLKIDIINGSHGPWIHLYSPFNNEINRMDPVDMVCIGFDCNSDEFEPYTGPLPDSNEYRAEQDAFDGCLSEVAQPVMDSPV